MSRLMFWRQRRLDANFQDALRRLREYEPPFEVTAEAIETLEAYLELDSQRLAGAEHRARQLLFSFLTEDQKRCFIEQGHFDVRVEGDFDFNIQGLLSAYLPNGPRVYRLHNFATYNVYLLGTNLAFCAYPWSFGERLPVPDILLGQKLVLETDEARFLETANVGDIPHVMVVEAPIPLRLEPDS